MVTDTRPQRPVPAPAVGADSLPWPSLLVLASVTFVLVTGEMLPTAVLPYLSADLGVPLTSAGMLVSIWAGTVVLASFPLVRLTARWNRRHVIAGAMVIFAVAAILTGAAASYALAVAARLVGAAVCGLVWAVVNAHTAAIVGERSLARAVAVVLAGATLGTVLGVPVAHAVAQLWDWRGAFVALGIAGLAAASATAVVVVDPPGATAGPSTSDAGPVRGGLGPVLAVAGLTGLVLVGHFAAFTFITTLLTATGRAVPGGVSGLLLLFGVLSAVGVLVVGRIGDRGPARTLVVATGLVAVALLGLLLLERDPRAGVAVVVVWGLATGALPPLAQTLILQLAGRRLRSVAATVIPVTFNLGIAVGAALGSVIVGRLGVQWLAVPSAGAVVLAALGLALVLRVGRAAHRTPTRGASDARAVTN